MASGERPNDVCVVVPVYNEADVIARVVTDLREYFPHVVCVDDGSRDGSLDAAQAAGATVLRHPINLGQGAALRTGIDHALSIADVSWIVTFDADGQHRPGDADRMVRRAREENVDVVLGTRFDLDESLIPLSRRVVLKLALVFTRLTTGLEVTDTHNGLRVLSRGAARRLALRQPGMAHASEILGSISRQGLRYVEEPVTIHYSEYSLSKGQSNLNAVNILHDLMIARLRTAR